MFLIVLSLVYHTYAFMCETEPDVKRNGMAWSTHAHGSARIHIESICPSISEDSKNNATACRLYCVSSTLKVVVEFKIAIYAYLCSRFATMVVLVYSLLRRIAFNYYILCT